MEGVAPNQSSPASRRPKIFWILAVIILVVLLVYLYLFWQKPSEEPVGPDGLTEGERNRIVAETSADPALGDGLTAAERSRIIAETSARPSN